MIFTPSLLHFTSPSIRQILTTDHSRRSSGQCPLIKSRGRIRDSAIGALGRNPRCIEWETGRSLETVIRVPDRGEEACSALDRSLGAMAVGDWRAHGAVGGIENGRSMGAAQSRGGSDIRHGSNLCHDRSRNSHFVDSSLTWKCHDHNEEYQE